VEFDQKRNWLKCEFSLNHPQPKFAQPNRNQNATTGQIISNKTVVYLLVGGWLRMVGCIKFALVGWGVCLRHPHRNHSTNRTEKGTAS